jgi:hypothetical protein
MRDSVNNDTICEWDGNVATEDRECVGGQKLGQVFDTQYRLKTNCKLIKLWVTQIDPSFFCVDSKQKTHFILAINIDQESDKFRKWNGTLSLEPCTAQASNGRSQPIATARDKGKEKDPNCRETMDFRTFVSNV